MGIRLNSAKNVTILSLTLCSAVCHRIAPSLSLVTAVVCSLLRLAEVVGDLSYLLQLGQAGLVTEGEGDLYNYK